MKYRINRQSMSRVMRNQVNAERLRARITMLRGGGKVSASDLLRAEAERMLDIAMKFRNNLHAMRGIAQTYRWCEFASVWLDSLPARERIRRWKEVRGE